MIPNNSCEPAYSSGSEAFQWYIVLMKHWQVLQNHSCSLTEKPKCNSMVLVLLFRSRGQACTPVIQRDIFTANDKFSITTQLNVHDYLCLSHCSHAEQWGAEWLNCQDCGRGWRFIIWYSQISHCPHLGRSKTQWHHGAHTDGQRKGRREDTRQEGNGKQNY